MKEYNVEMTAQAIEKMALELIYRSQRLQSLAVSMREKNDLTYASEVVSEITGMLPNLRLDLMITRPLRETMK